MVPKLFLKKIAKIKPQKKNQILVENAQQAEWNE